ncbi:hypothetical protein RFI_08869 [Reticulomyxa filosa]|uniref:Uncharacterized protein n=1 Tax=Reticulomyxa filosa TaxID=46433 RepID=X6NQR9_RETFI|nr:hypothetical protein RFI_08869 [Reticulomyxa filosa]|eukprot:ETO28263.1 hypothetical protein RFI_08869 [Reticulomyxa filosa]
MRFACTIQMKQIIASFLALFGLVNRSNAYESPFSRPSRVDNRARKIALLRECPKCERRLLNGTCMGYRGYCCICRKFIPRGDFHYCNNTTCERFNRSYCAYCAEHLRVFSAKQQQQREPGAPSTTSVILWSLPTDDYIGYVVRLTGPNVLAILGMVMEVAVMLALLLSIFFVQHRFNLSSTVHAPTDQVFHWLTKLSRVENKQSSYNFIYIYIYIYIICVYIALFANMGSEEKGYDAISTLFVILAFFWLIVVSLPLVCEELFGWISKKGTFVRSSMWIKFSWFYTRVFYLYFIVQWIQMYAKKILYFFLSICVHNVCIHTYVYIYIYIYMFQCVYVWNESENNYTGYVLRYGKGSNECLKSSWHGTWSYYFMAYFWLTSCIIMVYHDADSRCLRADQLDIRYPLAFYVLLQILQSLFVVVAMLYVIVDPEKALLWCLILSIAMCLWHIIYPLFARKMTAMSAPNPNYVYQCTSIPHIVVARVALYTVLVYVAAVLFEYSKNPHLLKTQQLSYFCIRSNECLEKKKKKKRKKKNII